MRRILGFALLSCALVVGTADVASARGCRGSRCHSCCSSCCTTSCAPCAASTCATCTGDACVATAGTAAGEMASTILVQLPADAVLTIDGRATSSTSSVRSFRTPTLARGHTYTYTMQARMSNGEVVTQEVNFRAGERTVVRFDVPVAVAQR